MWDDDFISKKFELGRIIERDGARDLVKGMNNLDLQKDKPKD